MWYVEIVPQEHISLKINNNVLLFLIAQLGSISVCLSNYVFVEENALLAIISKFPLNNVLQFQHVKEDIISAPHTYNAE